VIVQKNWCATCLVHICGRYRYSHARSERCWIEIAKFAKFTISFIFLVFTLVSPLLMRKERPVVFT
jgi:hypothetical protein